MKGLHFWQITPRAKGTPLEAFALVPEILTDILTGAIASVGFKING